jgi:cell division protease FtsH
MVCEWGMSNADGPLTFGKKEEQIFLGREIAQHQDLTAKTPHCASTRKVQALRHRQLRRAQAILTEHMQRLTEMASAAHTRDASTPSR